MLLLHLDWGLSLTLLKSWVEDCWPGPSGAWSGCSWSDDGLCTWLSSRSSMLLRLWLLDLLDRLIVLLLRRHLLDWLNVHRHFYRSHHLLRVGQSWCRPPRTWIYPSGHSDLLNRLVHISSCLSLRIKMCGPLRLDVCLGKTLWRTLWWSLLLGRLVVSKVCNYIWSFGCILRLLRLVLKSLVLYLSSVRCAIRLLSLLKLLS